MSYEIGNGCRASLAVGGRTIPVGINEAGGKLFIAVRASFHAAFKVGDVIHLTGLGPAMARNASGAPPPEADFKVLAETGSGVRGVRQFRVAYHGEAAAGAWPKPS